MMSPGFVLGCVLWLKATPEFHKVILSSGLCYDDEVMLSTLIVMVWVGLAFQEILCLELALIFFSTLLCKD